MGESHVCGWRHRSRGVGSGGCGQFGGRGCGGQSEVNVAGSDAFREESGVLMRLEAALVEVEVEVKLGRPCLCLSSTRSFYTVHHLH